MDCLRAMLDEEDQQIEVARDQSELSAASSEDALARREHEIGKPVARQAPKPYRETWNREDS